MSPTILHLSDLHLGSPASEQVIDDHKKAVGGEPRIEKDVLRESIARLLDTDILDGLAAVVVSGDLTNQCDPKGFGEFPEIIAPLVDRVGKENIVVVPGNHDVPWDPQPGEVGRYDGFISASRAHGFVTPLLDTIDFQANGDVDVPVEAGQHLLQADEFVVIPLNSSHFCWGKEPLTDSTAEALMGSDPDIQRLVEDLRRHDIARVSAAQVDAILSQLRIWAPELVDGEDKRTKIAVLHHHLLPVSQDEELKSFESLSNLGAVRRLLSALGVELVLHGHKHVGGLYWDYVSDPGSLDRIPSRMVVASAPARFRRGETFARLITVEDRDLVIEDVVSPPTAAESPARVRRQRARLWVPASVDEVRDAMVLSGDTISEVYGQLRSVFADRRAGSPLRELVCEIRRADNAELLPDGYPVIEGVDDVQAWFTDLVGWWQLAEPQFLSRATFNHGERIYRHWPDQVERAIAALKHSAVSTRAVISLLDPATDFGPSRNFPSFVTIQLQLVERRGRLELDCVGHFRKQEMRYWWPINVAELARVQAKVREGLHSVEYQVKLGRLITIAGYAAVENRLPSVALAAIDRAVDQHPEDLWAMAYFVAHKPAAGEAKRVEALWWRYLSDLEPPQQDGESVLLVSHHGLLRIRETLGWMKQERSPVYLALDGLIEKFDLLGEGRRNDPNKSRALNKALDGLRSAVEQHFSD